MRLFTNFLKTKYVQLHIDMFILQKMVSCGMPKIPVYANTELDQPITMDELLEAVKKGKQRHSPGQDGICHEFCKQMWDIVKHDMLGTINHTYTEGPVSDAQKYGHILCLPKKVASASPEDYRPLTILNTGYKLLNRITANRLRPWMKDILHHNQYCGRNDQTIFEAIATVRDIITYAEGTNILICLLSIDFKDAYDRMSHSFLFTILREYRISEQFCSQLQKIYAKAPPTLTLNGHKSTPIKTLCGVQQSCPLNMLLFALCIIPSSST